MYINGIGSLSAQILTPRVASFSFVETEGNRAHVQEPDYKEFLPPMQLRRMSRVVKFGMAAAVSALKDAGIEKPDIITTGTAYGCLADTGNFLQKMIVQAEALLTPTAFIQSTHNTVSGQIALLLSCHGHNFTYVQRGHSFESSLQETMLWAAEDHTLNVLTGGIDELTQDSFDIMARFGTYKNVHDHYTTASEGCIAGEGANVFLMSGIRNEKSYAELCDLRLCVSQDIAEELGEFLKQNQIAASAIDTVLIGSNGDKRYDDMIFAQLQMLEHARFIDYKRWCGEYPTSGAFGMALASVFLHHQKIPDEFICNGQNTGTAPKHILICNHYKNQYHSFILLRSI